MAEALLLLIAGGSAYSGFALFALSQSRHWQHVVAGSAAKPPQKQALRMIGGLALALALACSWLRDGPAFGSVLWLLLLSVAAPLLAFTLSWRPQWLKQLALRLAVLDQTHSPTGSQDPVRRG